MAISYTDLLTAVKNTLKADTDLAGVRTWKRGVLPVKPVFPAIALMPVTETRTNYHSGGLFYARRPIDIEVYSRGHPIEIVKKTNQDLLKRARDVILENISWGDECLDSRIVGEMREARPIAVEGPNTVVVSMLRVEIVVKDTIVTS